MKPLEVCLRSLGGSEFGLHIQEAFMEFVVAEGHGRLFM